MRREDENLNVLIVIPSSSQLLLDYLQLTPLYSSMLGSFLFC